MRPLGTIVGSSTAAHNASRSPLRKASSILWNFFASAHRSSSVAISSAAHQCHDTHLIGVCSFKSRVTPFATGLLPIPPCVGPFLDFGVLKQSRFSLGLR